MLEELLSLFEDKALLSFAENVSLDFNHLKISDRDFASTDLSSLTRRLGYLGRKRRYYDFLDESVQEAIAWPNEIVDKKGLIQESDLALKRNTGFVNASKATAHAWFLNFTEAVAESGTPESMFVLGDPGTGKSTLLKYLPNALRNETSKLNVIYTRFEAHKFLEVAKKWSDQESIEKLITYLYVITLRDVITNDAISIGKNGLKLIDKTHPLFGKNNLDRFFTEAVWDHDIQHDDESKTLGALRLALGQNEFRHRYLFEIESIDILRLLVNYAVGSRKVVFIFDGLDLLQPHDQDVEREKYSIFSVLMKQFSVTNAEFPVLFKKSFQFYGGQIVVQRHRTYQHWMRQFQEDASVPGDIEFKQVKLAYVTTTPATTILRKSVPNIELGDQLSPSWFYTSIRLVLREVCNTLAPNWEVPKNEIFGFFDGNLRDEFEFIRRVLVWIASEVGRLNDFSYTMREFNSDLRKVDTIKLINARKYRIIQLLLKWESPSFENLVHFQFSPLVIDGKLDGYGVRKSRNRSFTGLVDNIFNYNTANSHTGSCEHHCLLLKIRVLQLLDQYASGQSLTEEELWNALVRFGYANEARQNLGPSLRVLRYGNLIKELNEGEARRDVLPTDLPLVNEKPSYSITKRGKFAVKHLMFNTGYIESIFHKTLLPEKLIVAPNQRPRDAQVRDWARNSIGNYYVFLRYIEFVESNSPAVYQFGLSLVPQLRESIVKSVKNMCTSEFKDEEFLLEVLSQVRKIKSTLDSPFTN